MIDSLAGIVFPSGVASVYDYDASGRIGSITHHDPASAVLAGFAIDYNDVGSITGISEPDRVVPDHTREFGYDSLQRLTAETETPGTAGVYDYDAVGNRVSSPLSSSHSYGATNRLSSDDQFTYTYDAGGNLVTKTSVATPADVTTYTWNARSELVAIDLPGGGQATYRYDALGRRIDKTVGAAVTRYVYDGEDIALEMDGAGSLLRRYRHGDGVDQPLVLEDVTTGESYFYHSDHLGSVVALTDEGGSIVSEYAYDAYGNREAVSEDVEQPYAFTGREWDLESGLYYYRARYYYDPAQGRFVSPRALAPGEWSQNLYTPAIRLPGGPAVHLATLAVLYAKTLYSWYRKGQGVAEDIADSIIPKKAPKKHPDPLAQPPVAAAPWIDAGMTDASGMCSIVGR